MNVVHLAQQERESKAVDIFETHATSQLKDLSLKEGEKVHISISSSSVIYHAMRYKYYNRKLI